MKLYIHEVINLPKKMRCKKINQLGVTAAAAAAAAVFFRGDPISFLLLPPFHPFDQNDDLLCVLGRKSSRKYSLTGGFRSPSGRVLNPLFKYGL